MFVGGNGVGKTNPYRALELSRSAAANTLARDLARDGSGSSANTTARRGSKGSRTRGAFEEEDA